MAETLIESWFPSSELSAVIHRERRALDPVYGAHGWWARRPPALMRAILLSASLPGTASQATFWEAFNSDDRPLRGTQVYDPFCGGGSTLVEAARLGANVRGGDVDPVAVEIVRSELTPADSDDVRAAGAKLLSTLTSEFAALYPIVDEETPLHYFSVARVTCPSCLVPDLMYRDLVLARDRDKSGAVVRDFDTAAFCPQCLTVHELRGSDRTRLHCCGRYWPLDGGTFTRQRYECRNCGTTSTHRDLATGRAPRVLVAREVICDDGRRRFRSCVRPDAAAVVTAEERLRSMSGLKYPTGAVPATGRSDDRPRSYGITTFRELFSARQLLVLARAQQWIDSEDLDRSVRQAMALAVSSATVTNNRLCGYARDYGRLSPLFSVRGYSLPVLTVEVNPLLRRGGRGTLAACIERVARTASTEVKKYGWDAESARPVLRTRTLTTAGVRVSVDCRSALDERSKSAAPDDLVVFDPPYFDWIAYDELSEFYRCWSRMKLQGTPLVPSPSEDATSFGIRLGACLRSVVSRLSAPRPLAFTFHSSNPAAWDSLGVALDEAKVVLTGLWPVRSDGNMGHHSHPGNCEWDLVLVGRRLQHSHPCVCEQTLDAMLASTKPWRVGIADRTSFELALGMASARWGSTVTGEANENLGGTPPAHRGP